MFSQNNESKLTDSIRKLQFIVSNNQENDDSVRLNAAKKALTLAKQSTDDSLILSSFRKLIPFYSHADEEYKSLNREFYKAALEIKDSSSLANANYNLGRHYLAALDVDSAYHYHYEAEKLYKAIGDDWNTAQVLLSIALIQINEKDFTGSELLSFEALTYLDKLPPTFLYTRKKAFVYNNLGMVFHQLDQNDEAIRYHKQALDIKNSLRGDNTATIDRSKSNIANVYRDMGDFEMANFYNEDILKRKKVRKERPGFYALVMDNYAYSLFLEKEYDSLPNLYLEALKLCDSAGAEYQKIIINQRLAEYYNAFEKQDSARFYAYQAKELSEKYHNDDLLKSLLILSKVEEDSLAVKYYQDYISLNDSIQKNERARRDKFFRIRYETNKIEKEKDKIARERMWLIILLFGVLITFFLIYVILSQRAKNKELKFEREQQQTNEEIYNLMLSQQEKVDEAKALEKKRISEELHDGILGRLFGTRLSLDSLNMNPSPEAIQTRSTYIEQLKDIEQDIRKVSHDLNTDFIANSGFRDIIKTLVERQCAAYKLNYKLNHRDEINWDAISNKTKIHIYRILQESLQNIYKHAQANTIEISFKLKNNVIWLTIIDDGVGFDVSKARQGIGLKNINSRAVDIDAQVKISSKKGSGTTLEIKIPVNNE